MLFVLHMSRNIKLKFSSATLYPCLLLRSRRALSVYEIIKRQSVNPPGSSGKYKGPLMRDVKFCFKLHGGCSYPIPSGIQVMYAETT